MSTPIYFYKTKNLSNLKADSIVAVKNDNESAFSLFITDKTGIPYPLKDLQNNVIITNTDGTLQITTSSTSTNINLASSILTTINSALQSGDNISEFVNDSNYTNTSYVDAKVTQNITNGVTTSAPSENVVFDALELKADKTSTYTKAETDNIIASVEIDVTNKVDKNIAIVASTKTKITYDEKGLVISGEDATKTDVGLSNVDNTSDLNKPISTANQTALNLKANIASPTFTGIPTAPTATEGTNTTQIASTAFVIANAGSGGSVNVVKNVWVSSTGNDSTALIGREDKPFLTINSALDALGVNGGIVNIGIGSFDSPLYSKIYPNTTFKGSGKPKLNNVVTGGSAYPLYTKTTATALIGGTILLGTFRFPLGDSLQAYDLGVDCGVDYCNAFNAGVALEGLMMSNDVTGNTTQVGKIMRKNVILKNITTIVKGSADLVHSFCIENCYEPYVDNVDTYNGFAGFVYKNIGGTASNIKSSNSGSYGIIIKTNTYASNNSTFLNGFEIDGGAGLTIQDEGDASGIQNVYISNGRIRNTSFGVNQIGTLLKYINISNVHCLNISGFGFDFSGIQFSNFLNNSATSCTSGGFKIIGTNNRLSENRASYNTGVGIELRTSSGTYPSISTGNDSSNNSTYGFFYSGDIRGGHNVAISNTTSAINGAITILDAPTPYVLPNPLSLSGAPGGYTPVLSVENTGTASVADKNVVIFKGNYGSDTSVDSNTTLGIWQKNNTVKNYGLISFFNSAGNTSAQLAVRNISQNVSQGSMAIITTTGGVLTPTLVAASSTNVLIGKDEFTGATNNDTGEKLQVVGTASVTGVIKAGAQVRLKNYTVDTLPAGVQGDTAYVTDATAPTYLGTLTGGGSVKCPVFYNGSAWVSH